MKYQFFSSLEESIPEPVCNVVVEVDTKSGYGAQIYVNDVAVLTLLPQQDGTLRFERNSIAPGELPYLQQALSARSHFHKVADVR